MRVDITKKRESIGQHRSLRWCDPIVLREANQQVIISK